jgi:hypothetical protein
MSIMATHDPLGSASPAPLVSPEIFLKEKVAPQFRRRIDDLRRQVASLEQQIQDRTAALASIRMIIDGEGGGAWYLNVSHGDMTVGNEPAFPPLLTIYQSRAYFDWAMSLAADSGLFGPSGRGGQNDLGKSRIERLKLLKGSLQFTFTDLPDGSERSFILQFGDGERPSAAQTMLSLKAEDAQKLARGELDPTTALMGGIIKINGDMALAMQFGAAMM